MPQLITFMMSATVDANELVALEASEFWCVCCMYVCMYVCVYTYAYT